MQHLSLVTVVARGQGLIEAEINNEIVALNVETGFCYGLNRVGSRIWSLLASPVTIGDICAKLLTEYTVEPDVCERQVLDLLEVLRSESLIATLGEK